MVNDLYESRKKHIHHLVLNATDLPRHLAFDLALETGSSVDNATSLALLRHFPAFTSIRRAGQRAAVRSAGRQRFSPLARVSTRCVSQRPATVSVCLVSDTPVCVPGVRACAVKSRDAVSVFQSSVAIGQVGPCVPT